MRNVCSFIHVTCQRRSPEKDKVGNILDINKVVNHGAIIIAIPEPATSAWLGNLVGMQIIASHCRLNESETLGVGWDPAIYILPSPPHVSSASEVWEPLV